MTINDVKPYPANAKKHPDDQLLALAHIVKEVGWRQPVLVDQEGVIVAGHGRIMAWQKYRDQMQLKDIWVMDDAGNTIHGAAETIPLTPEQELSYRLADNKLNESDWDMNLVKDDLRLLSDEMIDLTGFSKDLIIEVEEDGFDAEAEYNKIEEAVTQPGDLYQLGNHRLLCGDSTKREDVARLMGGVLADMVFTDPPYNVNYNYAKYEAIGHAKRKFKDGGKIFNDNKKPDEFYQFLLDVFRNIYMFSKADMSIYVCHATKTQAEFFNAFHDTGFHFSQTIIWLKERFILSFGQDWHRIYEPILFGWKEGENHYKNKSITNLSEFWNLNKVQFEEELDLWYINRDKSKEYDHPTQKPVRLPERAIMKNCRPAGVLFEPFGGSGSTMMAAERLNRKCYSIELDQKYCDVIIKRWELATNGKAIKL